MISFKYLIFAFLLMTSLHNLCAKDLILPLPIINRDDKLLKLTPKDLEFKTSVKNLKAEFVGDIKWERSKENILLPFVKIRLINKDKEKNHLHFRYKDTTYLPQEFEEAEFADIELSIFDPVKVDVYHDGQRVGDVSVHTSTAAFKNQTILLDYSCSGHNVQVFGFEGEFLSIGCELVRENINGEIIPNLKLHWISSEYKTLDNFHGPYLISFSNGRTAKVPVINEKKEKKEIVFKVKFPKRLHRARTSMGIGPYSYKSTSAGISSDTEILPSIMFYGNYYLNNVHSIKAFEALVMKESIFNHAGMYLGSEIGKFYDDRLVFSTLVGFQALSYRHDIGYDDVYTQVIFPQGAELLFHHPFGLENYRFSIGGFLSPQRDVTYQNFWLRFGSKTFLEFNFINWEYGSRAASMYGLSIGFPLMQFL